LGNEGFRKSTQKVFSSSIATQTTITEYPRYSVSFVCAFIVSNQNLFSKSVMTSVPSRVLRTPLCEAQSFPRMESAGKRWTAQILGNEPFKKKWTRFCENYFL